MSRVKTNLRHLPVITLPTYIISFHLPCSDFVYPLKMLPYGFSNRFKKKCIECKFRSNNLHFIINYQVTDHITKIILPSTNVWCLSFSYNLYGSISYLNFETRVTS